MPPCKVKQSKQSHKALETSRLTLFYDSGGEIHGGSDLADKITMISNRSRYLKKEEQKRRVPPLCFGATWIWGTNLYLTSNRVESSSSSFSSLRGAISTRSAGVVIMSYFRVFLIRLPDLWERARWQMWDERDIKSHHVRGRQHQLQSLF